MGEAEAGWWRLFCCIPVFVAARLSVVVVSECGCCRWGVSGLALCCWVCGRCGWGILRCRLAGCCLQGWGSRLFWGGRCLGSIRSWCSLSLLGRRAGDILCLGQNILRSFFGCWWWFCIRAWVSRLRIGVWRGLGGLSWVLFGLLLVFVSFYFLPVFSFYSSSVLLIYNMSFSRHIMYFILY